MGKDNRRPRYEGLRRMKPTEYTAYAAYAKARSMFAGMLRQPDYDALVRCGSVSELTSYLESRTRYDRVLKSVYSRDFHREQLENLLDGRMYMDYVSLCRYLSVRGTYLENYLKAKREVKILMQAVMHVCIDNDANLFYNILQTEFDRTSKLNIRAISQARSYDEIVQAASATEYYDALKSFVPNETSGFGIDRLDRALWNLIYSRLFRSVEKEVGGEEKRQILLFFGEYIDCLNFVTVRRLLHFGSLGADYIRSMMIDGGTIPAARLNRMIEAGTAERLYTEIIGTPLARLIVGSEESDSLPTIVSGKLCLHNMRFSTYPNIVVMSYMFLSELELSNIVKAVEGIRYSLPPEEILRMLIILF